MEKDNIHYLDEYPELNEKVQLKHRMQPQSLGAVILKFHTEEQELEGLRILMEQPPQTETLF